MFKEQIGSIIVVSHHMVGRLFTRSFGDRHAVLVIILIRKDGDYLFNKNGSVTDTISLPFVVASVGQY